MLIYGCLIFIQRSIPVPGTNPVILRSQRKRDVGRTGNTGEDSKYPVSQSLPAYLDFRDLSPESTGLGNYRSAIILNPHICFSDSISQDSLTYAIMHVIFYMYAGSPHSPSTSNDSPKVVQVFKLTCVGYIYM